MCWSKKYSNCRLNNYVQIDEVLHMQIEELSTSKNYVQIEVQSGDQRSILSADRRIICRSKNFLRVKGLSADRKNTYRLKNYLEIDWRSIWFTDPRIICKSKNYLQIKEIFMDQRIIPFADRKSVSSENRRTTCKLSNYLHYQGTMSRSKVHLQIQELSVYETPMCKLKNYLLQIEDL